MYLIRNAGDVVGSDYDGGAGRSTNTGKRCQVHPQGHVGLCERPENDPQKQAALAQQQAAASGQPLPLGTVVSALPGGCVATPVGGVNYYYCGGNFFQAMYQGSTLVYVTTKPK